MSTTTIAPPTDGLAAEVQALAEQVDQLCSIPATSVTVTELALLLVQLEQTQDRLAGITSGWLAAFDQAGGPEDQGAPSLTMWSRRELRVTPSETSRRRKRSAALDALPQTRAALTAGSIGSAQLDAIADGVHQLGVEVIAAVEPVLLDVAATCDANAVRATIRTVRDTLDPDAGMAAYLHALERRDVTVTQIGEGFDIRGFLDPETGAAFKQVLYSMAAKTSIDDERTVGQRRADGLGDLCRSVLDHGLPTDRGLRPHLYVTIPADRLQSTTTGKTTAGQPAVLAEFGPIPDQLVAKLACDCTITPIVADASDSSHVLDVGRTSRLATLKQRQAVFIQQAGACFNPGCDHTHLEIHHMVPWSVGGHTNKADLRGYCTRCHHLIHLGQLIVTPDGHGGWEHQTKNRQILPQHRRRASHLTRIYVQALTHAGKAHALHATQRYRHGRTHTVIRT